jgi:hypothetical protein
VHVTRLILLPGINGPDPAPSSVGVPDRIPSQSDWSGNSWHLNLLSGEPPNE